MRWPRRGESRRRSPCPILPARGQIVQLRVVLQEPFEALMEAWSLASVGLQHLDCEERDQPHHGADPERCDAPVREVQLVIVELVLLVPQPDLGPGDVGHRLGDEEEVLEELGGDVLVDMVVHRQLEGDLHQVEQVHRHPGGAVGLVDVAASGQRGGAVEDLDIVEAQEATLEDVAAGGVLAVHPPGEVQHQLVEDALQKVAVALPPRRSLSSS